MAPAKPARIFIAREDGYALVNGEHIYFTEGKTTVEEGHPLLKSCPASFKPFEPNYPVKPKPAAA